MNPKVWKEAETEVIKQGLLKKGGYMDIKEYIKEMGRQEGWQKGRLEGRQEVVLNMLKKKMDVSLIAEITNLSEKEIKKLKNGKQNTFS